MTLLQYNTNLAFEVQYEKQNNTDDTMVIDYNLLQ